MQRPQPGPDDLGVTALQQAAGSFRPRGRGLFGSGHVCPNGRRAKTVQGKELSEVGENSGRYKIIEEPAFRPPFEG